MLHLAQLDHQRATRAITKTEGAVGGKALAWVPFMMQRFNNEFMMRSSEAPAPKKKPSEYMRDMYFSSQPMEMTDIAALEQTFRMIKADTQLLYS
ncbi:MAG: hypothetical protein WCD13_25590, partial [Pseudolabrys sp.]